MSNQKMVLIGSHALKFHYQNLPRQPQDYDFLCTQESFFNWKEINNISEIFTINNDQKIIVKSQNNIYEFEIIDYPNNLSGRIFFDLVQKDIKTHHSQNFCIPSLDALFTLKKTHRYLKNSPHFWKNLADYHLMKLLKAQVSEEYVEFFKIREKATYQNQTHPKLNVNKKDFFAHDQVNYIYDHDSIHQAVKIFDQPAYLYYAKDGEQVKSDKEKFFALPESIRLAGVVEEACTLALERSLIPFPNVLSPEQAWKMAFSKVCTSITSGFFREYAYENALKVLRAYPQDYYLKFQTALKNNQIQLYKKE